MQPLNDDNADRHIGWAYISPIRRERIEAGIKALARIDKHKMFYDWHMIGEALADLQASAMDQSGSNKPSGKGYNQAWARCVADNPKLVSLSKLDKATRSNAMWLAANWEAVAQWHAELDDATRRLINHPATVRRRFNQDHPLPGKPRSAPSIEADEPDELGGEAPEDGQEESYNLEESSLDQMAASIDAADAPPVATPPTMEAFEAYWRSIPLPLRIQIAERIVGWLAEHKETASQAASPELELIADAESEIARSIAQEEGARVRALASQREATVTSPEPSQERIAMVAAFAAANPLPEGADPFAGLDDDLGASRIMTPAIVLARLPKLLPTEAMIIASRLNHPGWDDLALAKDVGIDASMVRHVLDMNGFRRKEG